MPQDRSAVIVGALAGLLVLSSVLMILIGLPEQTLLQRRLLQLYSVPLSGALGLGVVHLLGKLPALERGTKAVLGVTSTACVVGVALMAAGIVTGLDALLPLGQALVWLTLGFALLWVVSRLPRRSAGRTFGLRPVDENETADE